MGDGFTELFGPGRSSVRAEPEPEPEPLNLHQARTEWAQAQMEFFADRSEVNELLARQMLTAAMTLRRAQFERYEAVRKTEDRGTLPF